MQSAGCFAGWGVGQQVFQDGVDGGRLQGLVLGGEGIDTRRNDGQLRPIQVRDRSVTVETKAAEKADPGAPGHVAAPFAGVVSLTVEVGAQVQAGQVVATIEAMKMEASITTPVAGTVRRAAVRQVQQVEGGDLVLVVDPA